jgi:hypothetical protein
MRVTGMLHRLQEAMTLGDIAAALARISQT